jgi:hypothetical protein
MNLPVLTKYQNEPRSEREKSCELHSVESTAYSQWLIHGDVRTEVCKMAVGAFVLAIVVCSFLLRFVLVLTYLQSA